MNDLFTEFRRIQRSKFSTKLNGLHVEISPEMNDLVCSFPDLSEAEMKVRTTFYKTQKMGKKIEGLIKDGENNEHCRGDGEDMFEI